MTKIAERAAMFGGVKKGAGTSSSAASKVGGKSSPVTSSTEGATSSAPKWKKPTKKVVTPSPSNSTNEGPSMYKKPSQMKATRRPPQSETASKPEKETQATPSSTESTVRKASPTTRTSTSKKAAATSATPATDSSKNTMATPKLKRVVRSSPTSVNKSSESASSSSAPAYGRSGLKRVTPRSNKGPTSSTTTTQSVLASKPALKHVKTKVIGEAPTNNQGRAPSVASSATPAASKESTSSSTRSIPRPPAEKDWGHLYELAQRYDLYKQQEAHAKKQQVQARSDNTNNSSSPEPPRVEVNKKNIKARLEGIMGDNYTAKADWLDAAFIDKYLRPQHAQKSSYAFHFTDPKLFKRFDKTDEANRDKIILQFVQTLLQHEKQKSITELNMASCLVPDEFVQVLVEHILKNPAEFLPNLQVLNLESNALNTIGFQAVGELVSQHRFLQVLKLENQKDALSSAAEEAIAHAVAASPTIVVCSLRVRGGIERTMMNNQVTANIDALRQARRQQAKQSGTLKDRKRNEMETYFDNIAANRPGADGKPITSIDMVANAKFTGLNKQEQVKAAAALASNNTVVTVKMVKLQVGDDFAKAMGESLKTNTTIQKLLLDSNAFTGVGIQAILEGLSCNPNARVEEIQLRHQTKTMASKDEERLPPFVESSNMYLTKCGIDLRNPLVKMKVDRQMDNNREQQRKARRNGGAAASPQKQTLEI